MSPRLLAPVLAGLAVLAGCGDQRTAAVPAPFVGTWHQVKAASASGLGIDDPQQVGFLAIGGTQALCDLEGLPRGDAAISEVAADPGLGSGRLTLANGLRLYLSIGHGLCDYAVPEGRVVGAGDWLDVQVLRVTGSGAEEPLTRLRLWSAPAVAAAALAHAGRSMPVRAAAPPPAVPIAAPPGIAAQPPARGRDLRFADAVTATGDQGLAAAAMALVHLRESGDAVAVAAAYRGQVLAAQRDLLRLIEQARQGEPLALAEATRHGARLERFARAYAAWVRDPQ